MDLKVHMFTMHRLNSLIEMKHYFTFVLRETYTPKAMKGPVVVCIPFKLSDIECVLICDFPNGVISV